MYKIIIPMVLALTSIVFLGSGISGFVVLDNTDQLTRPYNWGILLSLVFLIASMLSFFLLNRKH